MAAQLKDLGSGRQFAFYKSGPFHSPSLLELASKSNLKTGRGWDEAIVDKH